MTAEGGGPDGVGVGVGVGGGGTKKPPCGGAGVGVEQELGYIDEPELIHRDNLVVTE